MPDLDLTHAAILSMDFQSAIISNFAQDQPDLVPRAASILTAARERSLPIIHIKVGFRPGLPEVSARNEIFATVKNSPEWQQLFQGPGGAIHPDLAPDCDEIVVTKHRFSAFTGTDLTMILRANDINTLILFGITTSGVVLSTLLQAADFDYRLIVIKDCCADQDPDVHTTLTEKFFPRLATVLTTSLFLEALKQN